MFLARLIKKKLLLPVLLGLKFKIATLIPLIFGLLVLLVKKIVFVSKLALVLGSALGLGTLLFGLGSLSHLGNQGHHPPQYYPPDHYHGPQQYHPTTFSHPYKGYFSYKIISSFLKYIFLGITKSIPMKVMSRLFNTKSLQLWMNWKCTQTYRLHMRERMKIPKWRKEGILLGVKLKKQWIKLQFECDNPFKSILN